MNLSTSQIDLHLDLYLEAKRLYDEKDYHAVISIATEAMEMLVTREFLKLRGWAYNNTGEVLLAHEDFQTATRLWPGRKELAKDADLYNTLVIVIFGTKLEKARSYRNYYECWKGFTDLSINTNYRKVKRKLKAVKPLLTSDEQKATWKVIQAMILTRENKPELAERLCKRALKEYPECGFAHFQLGLIYQDQGREEEMIDAFAMAIAKDMGISDIEQPLVHDIPDLLQDGLSDNQD